MATLTGPAKVFIVQQLACFERPVDIQAAVLAEFKLKVTLPQLSNYDPTNAAGGRSVGKMLTEVFKDTRAKYLADTQSIPIANKAWRLRKLSKFAQQAEDGRNLVLAASMLEQAAKEVGEVFTNRTELTGKGGRPLAIFKDYSGRKAEAEADGVVPLPIPGRTP